MFDITTTDNRSTTLMRAHPTSALSALRAMAPVGALSTAAALRLAQTQADQLLAIAGVEEPPVFATIITRQPGIVLSTSRLLPVSGLTFRYRGHWRIVINSAEPWTRRRTTLAHEFKHIIDHPDVARLYAGPPGNATRRAETAADFFAGALLMPAPMVRAAYRHTQDVASLAHRFAVSPTAMRVRLRQLHLIPTATDTNTHTNRRSKEATEPREAA